MLSHRETRRPFRAAITFAALVILVALSKGIAVAQTPQTPQKVPISITIADAPPMTPLVALSGPNSRIVTPAFQRVTSEKEWETLWQRHTGQPVSEYYDKSSMPRVNFDDCMVVAIFSGPSTANDGVSALSVTEGVDKLILRYSNRYMQIGMPDPKIKVKGAFGFFVLPRSSKPVVLEESVRDRKGAVPVVKVRAELPGI